MDRRNFLGSAITMPLIGVGALVRPAEAAAQEAITGEAIQKQIDAAAAAGGGLVQLPAASIALRQPLILRSKVMLAGSGAGTRLQLLGSTAVTTPTSEGVTNAVLRDLSIDIVNPKEGGPRTGLLLHNARYSLFANLHFEESFQRHTAIEIAPTQVGPGQQNFVLNRLDNITVDDCDTGVRLRGLGKGSTQAISEISNNVWSHVVLRKVRRRGIEAISWTDSEKWFGLYAQAFDPGCILVDLNTSPKEWQQIDRFHMYSPTLVYAPNLDGRRLTAIRLGPGTMKTFVTGLITDKVWRDRFVIDDGATSYWIQFDGWGAGSNIKNGRRDRGPGIHQKGFSTGNHGTIQMPAGKRSLAVPHELRRPPDPSELSLTPMSNLGGLSFWVAATDARTFTIELSEPSRSPVRFAWRANVDEIGVGGLAPEDDAE